MTEPSTTELLLKLRALIVEIEVHPHDDSYVDDFLNTFQALDHALSDYHSLPPTQWCGGIGDIPSN